VMLTGRRAVAVTPLFVLYQWTSRSAVASPTMGRSTSTRSLAESVAARPWFDALITECRRWRRLDRFGAVERNVLRRGAGASGDAGAGRDDEAVGLEALAARRRAFPTDLGRIQRDWPTLRCRHERRREPAARGEPADRLGPARARLRHRELAALEIPAAPETRRSRCGEPRAKREAEAESDAERDEPPRAVENALAELFSAGPRAGTRRSGTRRGRRQADPPGLARGRRGGRRSRRTLAACRRARALVLARPHDRPRSTTTQARRTAEHVGAVRESVCPGRGRAPS
jgi:hypothetical protein